MKKIILSAAILAVAGLTSVKASEIKNPVVVAVQQDSTTKTPVELKDLPEPVQKTLQSDPVKAWTPTAAFLVTNADKTSYYQVDVKKEQETGSLKIDKDGKIIQ
jgi:Tfp pilus assembly major pilin PilA